MEYGKAGAGARQVAERKLASAEEDERRAERKRREAANFVTGAEGEEAVAAALRELTSQGWQILHDRQMPGGGNIDHILVGPAAVIVLDTKKWNGELSVRNGRFYNGGFNQTRVIEALRRQRDAVAAVVADIVGGDGPVDCALVMVAQPGFGPEQLGDVIVIGADEIVDAVRGSRPFFSSSQVDTMARMLVDALPEMGAEPRRAAPDGGTEQPGPEETNWLFDRGNRFLYLNTWSNYGKRRVYVRDEDGEQYGYKNLGDGSLHLDHDDRFVAAVLAATTGTGLSMAPRDLPKVPISMPGGRVLSLVGRIHVTAIVGSLWSGRGKKRLYGYLVNPSEGFFELGHVDLGSGEIFPSKEGNLTRDRRPPRRYLSLLTERSPFEHER